MRKIIAYEYVTLDGVMESPEKWQFPYLTGDTAEFNMEQALAPEASLLGKVTYEAFAEFWPLQTHNEFGLADKFNSMPKFVVSSSLKNAAYNAETFGILDDLVAKGKIQFYGVSVERLDEAKKAIEFPGVQTVQLVFNMFRQRPIEDFFPEARQRQVGIIARVPLASGMLSGKMTARTSFARDDHRSFNRQGAAFDRGETFAGVDYELGLKAVEELRPLIPPGASMAQMALRWILMFDAVSCAIPGAKRPSQAADNISAAGLPPLSDATMQSVREIYDQYLRPEVHAVW